jgi:hypothetical protein
VEVRSRMKKRIKLPPRAARKRLLQLKAMTTMEELKQKAATEPGSKEEDQAGNRIMGAMFPEPGAKDPALRPTQSIRTMKTA